MLSSRCPAFPAVHALLVCAYTLQASATSASTRGAPTRSRSSGLDGAALARALRTVALEDSYDIVATLPVPSNNGMLPTAAEVRLPTARACLFSPAPHPPDPDPTRHVPLQAPDAADPGTALPPESDIGPIPLHHWELHALDALERRGNASARTLHSALLVNGTTDK
jgi:hypothetical protein